MRDQLALESLQMSLTTLGGTSISDCVATGQSSRSGHKVQQFVWKSTGKEFRAEISGAGGDQVFTTGNGNPAIQKNGKTTPVPYHVARVISAYHLPALIFANVLNNTRFSVTDAKVVTLNNSPVMHVRVIDESDMISSTVSGQEWYLDEASFLPVAVRYRIPDKYDALAGGAKQTPVLIEFSSYQKVDGMLVPFHLRTTIEGSVSDAQISSMNCNTGLSASDFAIAVGGR